MAILMQLADYLSRNKITLAEFSREIGVAVATVSRYAAGLRFPTRQNLERIRKATHGKVTANDFASMERAA